MLRLVGGAVAGAIAWIAIVTLLNLVLRHGWPAYAMVERSMAFTLPMLLARLAESAAASLASGALAARIGGARAALLGGGLLLLLFLPVHYRLWAVFPVWYHLAFLASLPLLARAGATSQATLRPKPRFG